MNIEQYIEIIFAKEGNGKFTNDPADSGGPTRWGITEITARYFGYQGRMEELPKEVAYSIYLRQYWLKPGFDKVNEIFSALAERLLDFGVLAGHKASSTMLQRALNVLNRNGRDYADNPADGNIGPGTIACLQAFVGNRGSAGLKVLLGMVAAQQSVYLMELAEKRPKDEEFMFGWQLNRSIGAIL